LKIELWEGGLLAHEVKALESIERHFEVKSTKSTSKKARGNSSLQEQLLSKGLKQTNENSGMFPWKGYAGFRLVEKGKEGEFDLLIVTHCNVIVVELKDWNHGKITARGNKWYLGNKDMGKSPVEVTRNKKFLIEKKLNKYRKRFSNQGYMPRVYFLVVMTGNADFSQLPEPQLEHTMALSDFLAFKNEHAFNKFFHPHPDAKVLNQDFPIFDELFDRNLVPPKQISINGYTSIEEIFEHPDKVYKEFEAVSESTSKDTALMRLWNFDNVQSRKSKTDIGRYEIVSREREVLSFIKNSNLDLYNHCLNSLVAIQKEQVNAQYSELYELKPGHLRFNEFVGRFVINFVESDRIKLVKLLLSKFADLHEVKIAHRDIGDHSIWMSPSKDVALSNFISAYHQPQGTVGDHIDILSVAGSAPFNMPVNQMTTPYQIDVYTLAVMAWHILNAERISTKSLLRFAETIDSDDKWYTKVIRSALAQTYTNATDMYSAFTNAEPQVEINLDFDESVLDPYKRPINIARHYPEDDGFIVETDEKEVYHSNGMLVKSWLGISYSNDKPQLGYQLLQFLERISKLQSIAPPYLPRIFEYGLSMKSSALFMVSDIAPGKHCNEIDPGEQNLTIVKKLISAVEHLHSLHLTHGDLHPGNVLIDIEEDLKLIDIPDFRLGSDEIKNNKYSPDNIDHCTAYERDNFAVMRMSVELLGLEWGQPSDILAEIAEVVQVELNDSDYGFKSLERFRDSLNISDDEIEFINISVRGNFEPLEILPDNGSLYVDVCRNDRDHSQVKVELFGVGGRITLIFMPNEGRFKLGFAPRNQSDVSRRQRDSSKFEVPFGLRVTSTEYSNLRDLEVELVDLDGFQRAISLALAEPSDSVVVTPSDSLLSLESDESLELTPVAESTDTNSLKSINITTKDLWKRILETEAESHPYIELVSEAESVDNHDNHDDQVILNHDSEVDPLASFKKNDVIEVIKVREDSERIVGIVDLKKSDLKEVRLMKISHAAKSLQDGDVVFFRTKQDKASYEKRKDALERILEKESTVAELVEYFEPDSIKSPIKYGIELTDADFARYNRKDDHGNEISLNLQQRQAFQQLLDNGPLSLLQGPPGTGKTEFIAAFVHYLVEKQGAERILMVSQSHEAVNTAAERVRKHCLRLKTPLDVVRFSNRDNNVSDGLKDVYSQSLIDERRALFIAESSSRLAGLSQSLGFDKTFLVDASKLELTIIRQVDNLIALKASIDSKDTNKEDVNGFKKAYQNLYEHVHSQALKLLGFDIEATDLCDIPDKLWGCLTSSYAITPNESRRAKALCSISRDMLEVLESERVNYDEFFARSRHLVTGTCVGIGQRHIGINQNQYDWVIIDEAARSIASELAIAMQAGKRVLLVGDHHQLPPLYTKPHKRALARKLGVVSNDVDLDELLQSDFARAFESDYGEKAGATLLTQYRMAEPISNLVSDCFYEGKLKTGEREIPSAYGTLPQAMGSFVSWLDTASLGKAAHHQKDPKGSSIANNAEVDAIIKLLKLMEADEELLLNLRRIVDDGEPAIGVICMYAEQKKRLRRKFVEQHWDEAFKSLVRIDTVDSYQGKENRIVIVSITRSIGDQSTGFLRSPNRINVALSRAMDRLVIVGNSNMWRGKNHEMPLGRVLEYVESRSVMKDGNYAIVEAKKLPVVSK
jgi:serine/threonine protein kinase